MAGANDIAGLIGLLAGGLPGGSDIGGTGSDTAGSAGESGDMFGDMDPEMLLRLLDMISKLGETDKNTELLNALRPHLRPENRPKLDRAARLMKLMSIIPLLRDSGIDLFG